jgi:hypothetical protein
MATSMSDGCESYANNKLVKLMYQQKDDPTFTNKIGNEILKHTDDSMEAYKLYMARGGGRGVVGMSLWMLKSGNEFLSTFMNISEEAFALLVLENSCERWLSQVEGGDDDESYMDVRLNYQKQRSKRMLRGNQKRRCAPTGEWTRKGIQRFNELCILVKEARKAMWRERLERMVRTEVLRIDFKQTRDNEDNASHGRGTSDNECNDDDESVVPYADDDDDEENLRPLTTNNSNIDDYDDETQNNDG